MNTENSDLEQKLEAYEESPSIMIFTNFKKSWKNPIW